MSLLKWALVGLLAVPAAELTCFLLVATFIGWFWAGTLLIATSLIGIMLLKRSGRHDLSRLAEALRTEGLDAFRLSAPGAANLAGALLLIFPGFLTDLAGVALLVPRWRNRFAAALAKAAGRRAGDRRVIDLAPGEWHQLPESQRSRGGKDGSGQ